MSGTVTPTETPLASLTVVSGIGTLRVLGFSALGIPFAIEPAAFAAATGGGGTGGAVALSDAVPLALAATGAAGTALAAARGDHTHPRPTATQIGAAPAVHGHSIADVAGLSGALDSKAPANHTHAMGDVAGLGAALAGKADTAHQHPQSDIAGLGLALSGKQDTTGKGVANGYAALDASGKVPSTQLPASTTGTSNVTNATVAGQYPAWNVTTQRYEPASPVPDTARRTATIERNSATTLSFAEYNRRNIALTGTAPLTLAATETGTANATNDGIGFECLIYNDTGAQNTITFGAGIEVNSDPPGTGTGGVVKIGSKGILAVSVMPVGATRRVALVRGKIE